MGSVNKAMTAAEKAQRLQDMAEHPFSYNMSNGDAEIAAEAAAHFRTLVPDANGLLPCPMCGAGALIMREQRRERREREEYLKDEENTYGTED
jgi:hypothetical protein